MDRILHDANNAQRILKLTADTMLLVDRHGVCVDIEPHCDLWFLQENILLGKNIFEPFTGIYKREGDAHLSDCARRATKHQQELQVGAERRNFLLQMPHVSV